MAFLFRVETGKNSQPVYFVKIAKHIDYVNANVAWMDDVRLPTFCDETQAGTLVPDIDIAEECHEFESEALALVFMAEHYRSELDREQTGS